MVNPRPGYSRGLIAFVTGSDAWRESIFPILMAVALASSLNILLGYTGYVSFGHIVFYGFGGYVGFYLLTSPLFQNLPLTLAGLLLLLIVLFILGGVVGWLRAHFPALRRVFE